MHTVARCGDNVIADIDSATGTVVRTYVTPMLDSNVSVTIAGATPTTYYYNQDERQSVMNLTDSTGVVAASYGYSAYGDPIDPLTQHTTPAPLPNRYTYTGRELSEASGDYYFRSRFHSVGTGSFHSRDTLEYIDGMSMYLGYFNMFLTVDPFGHNLTPELTKEPLVPGTEYCALKIKKYFRLNPKLKKKAEELDGKCPLKLLCDGCCRQNPVRTTRAGQTNGPDKNNVITVRICEDNVDRAINDFGDQNNYLKIIAHEMQHYFDTCEKTSQATECDRFMKKGQPTKIWAICGCASLMCGEMRARVAEGRCKKSNDPEDRLDCWKIVKKAGYWTGGTCTPIVESIKFTEAEALRYLTNTLKCDLTKIPVAVLK